MDNHQFNKLLDEYIENYLEQKEKDKEKELTIEDLAKIPKKRVLAPIETFILDYQKTIEEKLKLIPNSLDKAKEFLLGLISAYNPRYYEEVQELLNNFDGCLIIDAHSFPTIPLPYEASQELRRPQICLGTDGYHSPEDLIEFIRNFFEEISLTTEINRPFKGCYVPAKFLHRDKRVKSIMIEINRELYMDEDTGEKNDSFVEIQSNICRLINQIIVKFL